MLYIIPLGAMLISLIAIHLNMRPIRKPKFLLAIQGAFRNVGAALLSPFRRPTPRAR